MSHDKSANSVDLGEGKRTILIIVVFSGTQTGKMGTDCHQKRHLVTQDRVSEVRLNRKEKVSVHPNSGLT